MDIISKRHIFFFQKQSFIDIFQKQPFFKKQEIYSEAATHLLKHKKYIQKQLHFFFHGFCTKYTHFVLKNLAMIMKTSLIDGLKTSLFKNLTPSYFYTFAGPCLILGP